MNRGSVLRALLHRINSALFDSVQSAKDKALQIEDLFVHHPTPMWVYDRATDDFLAVNDAAVQRYGYTEQEFLQRSIRDIRPAEDLPRLARQRTPVTPRGYGDAGVWRHLTKQGEVMHMHITLNEIDYRGRKAVLVMAREVTGQIQARAELEALNQSLEARVAARTAELEHSNLELDAFARSAAHDLRTPLNAVLGFAQILAQRFQADEQPDNAKLVGYIEDSAQSMLRLIEGLLLMSKVAHKSLAVERIDLSALARQCLKDVQFAQPRHRVTVDIEEGLFVDGDPTLLYSLLSNLLSNAWKFTRGGVDPRLAFGAKVEADGGVAYFVRDNGVGFPMESASRLFRPFHRLHNEREFEGSGVGLVTCQRIVRRHGGRIWAESAPGVGTTLWFTLGEPQGRAASTVMPTDAAGARRH